VFSRSSTTAAGQATMAPIIDINSRFPGLRITIQHLAYQPRKFTYGDACDSIH